MVLPSSFARVARSRTTSALKRSPIKTTTSAAPSATTGAKRAATSFSSAMALVAMASAAAPSTVRGHGLLLARAQLTPARILARREVHPAARDPGRRVALPVVRRKAGGGRVARRRRHAWRTHRVLLPGEHPRAGHRGCWCVGRRERARPSPRAAERAARGVLGEADERRRSLAASTSGDATSDGAVPVFPDAFGCGWGKPIVLPQTELGATTRRQSAKQRTLSASPPCATWLDAVVEEPLCTPPSPPCATWLDAVVGEPLWSSPPPSCATWLEAVLEEPLDTSLGERPSAKRAREIDPAPPSQRARTDGRAASCEPVRSLAAALVRAAQPLKSLRRRLRREHCFAPSSIC